MTWQDYEKPTAMGAGENARGLPIFNSLTGLNSVLKFIGMKPAASVRKNLRLNKYLVVNIMSEYKKQFVICIDNTGYPASLEVRKLYQTLPDPMAEKIGHIRVIDESGEDYLYPEKRFMAIDLPEEAELQLLQAA